MMKTETLVIVGVLALLLLSQRKASAKTIVDVEGQGDDFASQSPTRPNSGGGSGGIKGIGETAGAVGAAALCTSLGASAAAPLCSQFGSGYGGAVVDAVSAKASQAWNDLKNGNVLSLANDAQRLLRPIPLADQINFATSGFDSVFGTNLQKASRPVQRIVSIPDNIQRTAVQTAEKGVKTVAKTTARTAKKVFKAVGGLFG